MQTLPSTDNVGKGPKPPAAPAPSMHQRCRRPGSSSFFKGILDIYRAWLREPISWAVQLVWPASWPAVSSSAIDLFVVWSAFYLAVNIGDLRINGKSYIRNATAGSGYLEFIAIVFFSFIFIPLVVLYIFAFSGKHLKSNEAKVPLLYVVVLMTVVAGLAFLNWELRGVA
jgi:hypothetical protein